MHTALRILSSTALNLTLLLLFTFPAYALQKQVIANGGASAYLTANTLPSIAMGFTMAPDSIKLDLLLTSDNEIIVFSSPTLGSLTDAAEHFPEKAREDGSFHVIDFSLEEIEQLILTDPQDFFPADSPLHLRIPTLIEALSLIRGLERSLLRSMPVTVEPRQIWLYRKKGMDFSRQLLPVLQRFNYAGNGENMVILSFDAEELKRLKNELMPEMGMNLKLIQLIDSNVGTESMVEEWGEWVSYNYDWMFSKSGLRSIARYADGIGLHRSILADNNGTLLLPDFTADIHQLGMKLYTFPVNKNDHTLLTFVNSFAEELEFFYFTAAIDGIITDYCQDALTYLQTRPDTPAAAQQLENPLTPPQQLSIDPLQLILPAASEGKE